MVGAKTVEELDKTEVTSMCIPPYKSAVYPIKLSVNSVQLFKQKMEYVINGMHIFSVDVVAEVVPVTLETSEEHLNFAFSAGNWAQYIERTILLDNPHSFDAEFECLLSNKFFSVDTPQGHVSECPLHVAWPLNAMRTWLLRTPLASEG